MYFSTDWTIIGISRKDNAVSQKNFMDLNDDEMNDWLDNKSDGIPLFPIRYCIQCERIVAVMDEDADMHTVVWTDGDEYGYETFIEPCYGPFTLSTPPDNFDEDWDMNLKEPSPEELAEMNLQAEQLLQELEG